MKHLQVLREIGPCTLASARFRPVGFGWTDKSEAALKTQGYNLTFREDFQRHKTPAQWMGMVYAGFFKTLKSDKAFGHSNPYHRYAFSGEWWYDITRGFDIASMHYGFWSRLPTACPKVVILHELLSNYCWEGHRRESKEFYKADLVIVVGDDEAKILRQRGIRNVLWSPPVMPPNEFPVSDRVGLVGTRAPQNVEGLRWLEKVKIPNGLDIHVYGNLSDIVTQPGYKALGRYEERAMPYQECGIHLMTRGDRPGLQIKVVEALACGRAIVARRGSMRGLPPGEEAWIDVETPGDMLTAAMRLRQDQFFRERLASQAKAYYRKHLSSGRIISDLRQAYLTASRKWREVIDE